MLITVSCMRSMMMGILWVIIRCYCKITGNVS